MNQSFVDKIKPLAQAIEAEFKIPFRICIIQAAHESNWGQSGLTARYNNLFGMTASEGWQKQFSEEEKVKRVAKLPTIEFIGGQKINVVRDFRAYPGWLESLRDWAFLIKARYPKAYAAALKNDSAEFFRQVQAGGYATDPKYANKLIALAGQVKIA